MATQTIITFAILGLAVLFIIAALFIRRTIAATIKRFSWERKVLLEHYLWMEDTSYSGYPKGSRNHHSVIESYQSYQMIGQTTTTNSVNGTPTTTTSPVYGFVPRTRTKYTYEIQKWVESRELRAKGEERVALHWPAYVLDAATQERVKRKQETYLVVFQSAKGKIYKLALPEADWTALDDTCTYTLKVDLFGHLTRFVPNAELVVGLPPQTS